MFGLYGLTITWRVFGTTTKSMSSMATAPSKGWSPMTSAPTKPTRFEKRNSMGPT